MKLVIYGQVPSLKNLQRTTRNGRFYTDARVKKYMDDASKQIRTQWQKAPCDELENLTCIFYYDSKRVRDISNSLDTVLDVLKKIVVKDDCYKCIPRIQVEFGGVDVKNPRTEIWVDEVV